MLTQFYFTKQFICLDYNNIKYIWKSIAYFFIYV